MSSSGQIPYPHLGYGLGLRVQHYKELLGETKPDIDWLEILSENYLVPGGRPLHNLELVRQRYPLVMHGVSLSIGSSDPLDRDYLRQLRALADRIEPAWVSDHLCWTGVEGRNLHDLMPLPYTEEALAHVVSRVGQVQDALGRRILLENVSSYVTYQQSAMTEWEFLRGIAEHADCLILLDINNIFVSSFNHGFDPRTYIDAIPQDRVQQFHLAGHRNLGNIIIDTHDEPVIDPVWELYAHAVRRFGPVSTMIERDDNIPPFAELMAELDHARAIAEPILRGSGMSGLQRLEGAFQGYVYRPHAESGMSGNVIGNADASAGERLQIYADAYRLRLIEVLGNDFPGLKRLAGEEKFDRLCRAYIEGQPSVHFNIRWYGECLSHFLRETKPWNEDAAPGEMAAFEWAIGLAFDAPDEPVVTLEDIAEVPPDAWPGMVPVLQSGLQTLQLEWSVPAIRQAADQGGELPALQNSDSPRHWLIWRQDLTVYFRPMEEHEAWAIDALRDWASFADICEGLCKWFDSSEVAVHAAGLLKRWVTDNMICEIQCADEG